MRIATCTPVDFAADSQFFGRDSGMLCRGFQAAGYDAQVIMPGAVRSSDQPGVIRCSHHELERIDWWRARKLDLVVLYAWGDPSYRPVAEAIRSAGIRLVQSLDTAGLTTPFGDIREWWAYLEGMFLGPLDLNKRIRLLAKACRDMVPSVYEIKRLAMIDCSDAVALVSEPAARSVNTYASALGFPSVSNKIMVIPHPISMSMVPSPNGKIKRVLVVGRWLAEDRHQKDPDLTLEVLARFLNKHPDWTAEICGRGASKLAASCTHWNSRLRDRLHLTEFIPREELVERYQRCGILLCASRHESFHISSAEALCCGCSIVVAKHPLLASTGWFTSRNSGTLAVNRSPGALAEALSAEAFAWESGKRDPARIAADWGSTLHADQVALSIVASMG